MRTVSILLAVAAGWFVICAVGYSFGADVNPGDDMATVKAVLGEPDGFLKSGVVEWYFYDRGEVRMRDGVVESATLMTEAMALEQKAERIRQRQEQARLQHERNEQRREEGESVRDAKIADPDFVRQPASIRLAFWTQFMDLYPEVSVFELYTSAQAEAQRDAGETRMKQQIADMERQLSQAEMRASYAEQAAEDALSARFTQTYIFYPSSPVGFYRVTRPDCLPSREVGRRIYDGRAYSSPVIRYNSSSMSGTISGGSYNFGASYGIKSGVSIIRGVHGEGHRP